jgi:hypothetical protein
VGIVLRYDEMQISSYVSVASECGIHIFRYPAKTKCVIFSIIYHS